MKTAAQTSHEIISLLNPIISDSDTMSLVESGWIKCVLDLERKWSGFIAEQTQHIGSIQEIEEKPQAKYLRHTAKILLESPRTYANEYRGLLGEDKWQEWVEVNIKEKEEKHDIDDEYFSLIEKRDNFAKNSC